MYREAAERAKQIQQEAIDNANAITNGSRQYADDMLADVQRYLNDYIKMLNANREELNGQVAPEYEEKDVEKSVSEQRALEERHEVTVAPSAPARPVAEPEDEEEEEEPVRPARKEPKKAPKPAAKPVYDDEEDEEPKKPRKKGWFKRMLEGDDEDEYEDDDNWSEDDEDVKEAPKPKKKRHKLFEIVEVDKDEDDEDYED